MRLFLIGCAALLAAGCAAEADDSAIAPALELTGRVVDAASILSPAFEAETTAVLEQLESDTGVQLVVATTPDLQGYEINDYSLNLARSWGLGSKERDDGLLILVAPNERKVRIEVGRGLEASVKDEEAASIIQDGILPHFREGDFEAGLRAGVDGLMKEVTPYELKEAA
ncbi:TPM domain-containing protein [Erythrobacter sp. JK5]|nr:TPM domain-containing protein [Erythrobacter sp. JK5]